VRCVSVWKGGKEWEQTLVAAMVAGCAVSHYRFQLGVGNGDGRGVRLCALHQAQCVRQLLLCADNNSTNAKHITTSHVALSDCSPVLTCDLPGRIHLCRWQSYPTWPDNHRLARTVIRSRSLQPRPFVSPISGTISCYPPNCIRSHQYHAAGRGDGRVWYLEMLFCTRIGETGARLV
jgi:hypothetical protein